MWNWHRHMFRTPRLCHLKSHHVSDSGRIRVSAGLPGLVRFKILGILSQQYESGLRLGAWTECGPESEVILNQESSRAHPIQTRLFLRGYTVDCVEHVGASVKTEGTMEGISGRSGHA